MTDHPTTDPLHGSNPVLVQQLQDEIDRSGPVTLARFMEVALYDPRHGYYLAEQRRPGRGGDFLTAPEASPYFGLTLARQLVECWERLGRPATWAIREYGSGVGGLAYDLIAGISSESPAAAAGLTYHLAEINPAARAEAERSMAEVGLADRVVIEDPLAPLPAISGVILGNEVADAMPVHRLVRRGEGWVESRVGWVGDWFGWVDAPLSAEAGGIPGYLADVGVAVGDGAVVDVSPAAAQWFAEAVSGLQRGYAIVIDYGYPAAELFASHRLEGTVRAYHGHTVTDDPLIRIGDQDLTAHVDFTALQRAGEGAGLVTAGITTQGALLTSLGMGEFLLDLQRDGTATLEDYYRAQATVMRLIDPGGLGRFRVLVMAKDAPVEPPLRAFSTPPPPF